MVAAGRLAEQAPDRFSLGLVVEGAERDVLASDANLATFGPWADVMLYEAGLRSARAIVQAGGFRIDSGARAHVTAIDAADALTNRKHHTIFVRLHRMRRRRHEFMYQAVADPTAQDLAQARRDVMSLIAVARAAIEGIT